MGVVAELILIRHGQSAANVAFPLANQRGLLESGLSGRDTDVELTELGVEQARAVGRWLATPAPGGLPEVVITSPYLRARETWRIAAETSGLSLPAPGTDDRLVDRLTGELELLTDAAIRQRFPDEPARFEQAGEYAYRPPGGETFSDIADRLTSFLDDLNGKQAGRRVVVVAHDSVVLMMRFVIEGLELAALPGIVAEHGPIGNASITSFRESSGRLVLDRYNTVDHLRP
ncbi:histidine phosphatase family protein [Actinoplanes auranticolor]|uniref:Phosphoglycerate mutase n=1 Tax=Actinoplanes auranticolor TaxID=47988 RepID=A0A919SQM7_9ACTN|nr:histidine phosphatase family protein [Actinoplanes auranticolor]GIM76621.1 phosphoglycerate mutase [Actinoplanes auranticolor]